MASLTTEIYSGNYVGCNAPQNLDKNDGNSLHLDSRKIFTEMPILLEQLSTSTNITQQIETRMRTRKPSHFNREPIERSRFSEKDRQRETWLATFLPCAVDEAVAQYQLAHLRGIVLYEMEPLQMWYVIAENLPIAMTRTSPETLTYLKNILQNYEPEAEAVLVEMNIHAFEILYVTRNGMVQTPGRQPRTPIEPLSFPPGVTSKRVTYIDESVGYECYHQTLGFLGRVRLVRCRQGQTEIVTEAMSDDPDDPDYLQRLALFQIIVQQLHERLFSQSGDTLQVAEQIDISRLQRAMQLFSAFVKIETNLETQSFLEKLSEEGYCK